MSSFSALALLAVSNVRGRWVLALSHRSKDRTHLGKASPHHQSDISQTVLLKQKQEYSLTNTRDIRIHALAISHSRSLHTRRHAFCDPLRCRVCSLFQCFLAAETLQAPDRRLRDGNIKRSAEVVLLLVVAAAAALRSLLQSASGCWMISSIPNASTFNNLFQS